MTDKRTERKKSTPGPCECAQRVSVRVCGLRVAVSGAGFAVGVIYGLRARGTPAGGRAEFIGANHTF